MRQCLILGVARQTCHAFNRGSKRRRPDARASSRPVVAHPEIGIKPGADELRRLPRRFVDHARRQGEQRDEDQIPSHQEAGRPKRDDAHSRDRFATAFHGAPPFAKGRWQPAGHRSRSEEVVGFQRETGHARPGGVRGFHARCGRRCGSGARPRRSRARVGSLRTPRPCDRGSPGRGGPFPRDRA